jgi:type IV pilus assembly protein PilY1
MNRHYSRKIISLAVSAGLSTAIASSAAFGADVEIYLEEPPEPIGPRILFVLDESGSMRWDATDWSDALDTNPAQRMYQLKEAMRALISDSSMDNVDIGILGYRHRRIILRRHSDFVTVGEGTNRQDLLDDVIGDAHLGGSNSGTLVHDGNTPSAPALAYAMNWYRDLHSNNPDSPIDTRVWCKPNYIVFLTDGDPNTNNMSTYSGIDCHNNERVANSWVNFQNSRSDRIGGRCSATIAEWGYGHQPLSGNAWSYTADLDAGNEQPKNVITHTIGFHVPAGSAREQYLLDIAERSPDEGHPIGTYPNANFAGGYDTGDTEDPYTGGRYARAANATDLLEAFQDIVASAATNVTFTYTAPTIPFNADNVAVSGDEIYVPMIAPEATKFWKGNIKKYHVEYDDVNEELILEDKYDNDVVSSVLTFMTNVVDFWNSGGADGADPLVGGAASNMTGSRNLYTYLGTNVDLTNTANRVRQANAAITETMLNADNATERNTLLYWVNWLESDGTTARTGEMGAPLHTQPVTVRYSGSNDLILVTTTEGILHAFDGDTGQELWSFMPDELLSTIKDAKVNVTATEPMYGLDGPMTYYEVGSDKYIVFGMRRGGRNYYALNITNRTQPTFAWEIRGGVDTDFLTLGQTWSKPIFTKMEIEGASEREVLVFGGGYDDDQDDATVRADDDLGNAIYIVNATTGALIEMIDSSDMVHGSMGNGIAADVLTVDINANGITDRLYAADVGGRLIRVDIPDNALAYITSSNAISGTIVADVGGADGFQRFFNTPEVAYYRRGGFTYLALMIASGHRPKPLDLTITDRFYTIRDFAVWHAPADGDGDSEPDYNATIDESLLHPALSTPGSSLYGWYLDLLDEDDDPGLKGFSEAKVYDYAVLFTAYTGESNPAVNPCVGKATVGDSYLYALDMRDGSAIFNVTSDGTFELDSTATLDNSDRRVALSIPGLPPSPTLMFPDYGGGVGLGGKVVAIVGLESPAQWLDRFHPISWEEVIED